MADAQAPTCLVTGSASGIGRALTISLLRSGWKVVGLDLRRSDQTDAVGFTGDEIDLTEFDVLRERLAGLPISELTAIVHCAGIMRPDGDPTTARRAGGNLWDLHVGVAEILLRQFADGLPDGRGRVVILSSRAAQGRANASLYAASKAAVNGFVRSWASALVARGVTVNAVAPSATNTPMLTDRARSALEPMRSLPIGRIIEPEEVAAAIAFLLSADAGAITGQTLVICGGMSLRTG